MWFSKVNKREKILMHLTGFLGYFLGPRPELVAAVYKAVVRPFVSYGCLVWANKLGRAIKTN